MTPAKKKALFKNLLLSFLSLGAALLAAELWLRRGGAGAALLQPTPYMTLPELPCSWTHAAHTELLERFLKSPPGTRTVLLLGDSVMASLGPVRPGGRAEVYNFAVNGYDLRQSADYLKYLLARKKPDLVVVGICLNDILSYHAHMLDQLEAHGRIYSFLGPLRRSALAALGARAYLRYRMLDPVVPGCLLERDRAARDNYRGPAGPDAELAGLLAAAGKNSGPGRPRLDFHKDYADPVLFSAQIAQPLSALAALGLADRLRVAVWPADAGAGPYWLEPLRAKIEREARRNGIKTVDLLPAYLENCRGNCFLSDGLHFTPYGEGVFREVLSGALRR